MKHHLVAGVSESARERAEVVGEESRQITEVLDLDRLLEGARVLPREDPRLERHARRVRNDRGERRRQPHDPLLGADLLTQDVAVEAAPLVLVILARLAQLAARLVEDDRDRCHARVRMVTGHSGFLMAS